MFDGGLRTLLPCHRADRIEHGTSVSSSVKFLEQAGCRSENDLAFLRLCERERERERGGGVGGGTKVEKLRERERGGGGEVLGWRLRSRS